jgi:hypothetical protein
MSDSLQPETKIKITKESVNLNEFDRGGVIGFS